MRGAAAVLLGLVYFGVGGYGYWLPGDCRAVAVLFGACCVWWAIAESNDPWKGGGVGVGLVG